MARTMSEEIKKNKSLLFYKIFMYCKMNNIYYDMYIQNISKYTLHLLKENADFDTILLFTLNKISPI